MTLQEYRIYSQKYTILQSVPHEADLHVMIPLQDAVRRAFAQEPGYERLWEEETKARIARQEALSRLPRHGR